MKSSNHDCEKGNNERKTSTYATLRNGRIHIAPTYNLICIPRRNSFVCIAWKTAIYAHNWKSIAVHAGQIFAFHWTFELISVQWHKVLHVLVIIRRIFSIRVEYRWGNGNQCETLELCRRTNSPDHCYSLSRWLLGCFEVQHRSYGMGMLVDYCDSHRSHRRHSMSIVADRVEYLIHRKKFWRHPER